MTRSLRDIVRSEIMADPQQQHRPFREDSIQVVREKDVDDHVVLAVRFEGQSGDQRHGMFGARHREDGTRH